MTGRSAVGLLTGNETRGKQTSIQVKKGRRSPSLISSWPCSYLGDEYSEVTCVRDQGPQLGLKACRETGAGADAAWGRERTGDRWHQSGWIGDLIRLQ